MNKATVAAKPWAMPQLRGDSFLSNWILLRWRGSAYGFPRGKALLTYFVIFSCLTLWSMMCRLASSARMSSTEMPICTISTRTW